MINQVKVKTAKAYKININTKNPMRNRMKMFLNHKPKSNKSKTKANTFELLLNI